jgi:hypothetical protein
MHEGVRLASQSSRLRTSPHTTFGYQAAPAAAVEIVLPISSLDPAESEQDG